MNQKQKKSIFNECFETRENFLDGTVEFFYSISSLKSEFTQSQSTNTLKLCKLEFEKSVQVC